MNLDHSCAVAMGNVKHEIERSAQRHAQELREASSEWERKHNPENLGKYVDVAGVGGGWFFQTHMTTTLQAGGGGGAGVSIFDMQNQHNPLGLVQNQLGNQGWLT